MSYVIIFISVDYLNSAHAGFLPNILMLLMNCVYTDN